MLDLKARSDMRSPAPPKSARLPARTRAGFSLIEVLVSMFIVSLGILALAGLLQSASRYGKMSEVRSTATLLANDIADHIRANLDGASNGDYDVAAPFPATAPVDRRNAGGDQCTSTSPPVCTYQEIAAVDLFNWTSRLLVTLPHGTPYVVYNQATGGLNQSDSVDVWVAWLDPGTTGSSDRPATECPDGLNVSGNPLVRCIYLQVGLQRRN
jgi:type IV pilus assembly protein PilV